MKHTILITGVQGGIGAALAARLARDGHRIVGTARKPETSDVLPLDLASDQSIANLAALVTEPIDILINNAGMASAQPAARRVEAAFDELSRDEFRQLMDVNLIGTFLVTRALLPNLRRGNRRTIVNLSSDLASISGNVSGKRYAYRCSKAALNMLTRTLAADLASEGFTCFSWSPAWVKTRMGGKDADISAEEAADALCEFLSKATPESNGTFVRLRGEKVAW